MHNNFCFIFPVCNQGVKDYKAFKTDPFATFEKALKDEFDAKNIARSITKLPFLKIRATNKLWQARNVGLLNRADKDFDRCPFYVPNNTK